MNNNQQTKKRHVLIVTGIIILIAVIATIVLTTLNRDDQTLDAGEAQQTIKHEMLAKKDLEQITEEAPVEKNTATYEEQIEALGELPAGYIVLQDIDGTVSYVSEEEYSEWLNQEVRENTVADENASFVETFEDIEIEIMPADDFIWHQIQAYPLDEINEDDIYQTRGQFIYFVQKAVPMLYAQNILAADFDTNTYVMEILLDIDSTFELPNDFEDRMLLAYQNSGYQVIAPDQLTIEYEMIDIDEFLENY